QPLGLAPPGAGGRVRGVPALEGSLDRFGAGRRGQEGELVQRRLGILGTAVPAADQEGALVDDPEVGLGGREPPALAPGGRRHRTTLTSGTPRAPGDPRADSTTRSRSTSTSKTWATGPPNRTVAPTSTTNSPPSTVTWPRAGTSPRR